MNWSEQSILITGGTGSFGRKFVELVLRELRPRKLIVFSRDELKQHEMRQQFPDIGDSPVRYFLGDVRDRERLYRAFYGVDVVVHAAALKQVPACEYNPFEAILTNVMGAKNVIDAAIDCGVKRVMALSTDKAVNPINLYGATKLCAEKLFVDGNQYAGGRETRFACARYGNVVASRGSVIPVFLEQRRNGRITITDPAMTRFWITLEQGVRFVVRSVEEMHGGEIFVPKIPSMTILELSRTVAPDCEIEMIGIRPGEKTHEILVSEDEARHTVELEDKFVILPVGSEQAAKRWKEGRPLSAGFRYASDANTQQLTPKALSELLGPLG
jgi:UDP-N-acetylglucosamine 4,6-dehydratase/5-epimerase